MVKEQKTKQVNVSVSCADQFCPQHGKNPLRIRGRIFEGTVFKKLPGRIQIVFERVLYDRKYERYEKRKTKLHARLPDCLKNEINVGDYIEIGECRALSKIIHCVVIRKIRSGVLENKEDEADLNRKREKESKVKEKVKK